jgi:hypothetical protein
MLRSSTPMASSSWMSAMLIRFADRLKNCHRSIGLWPDDTQYRFVSDSHRRDAPEVPRLRPSVVRPRYLVDDGPTGSLR